MVTVGATGANPGTGGTGAAATAPTAATVTAPAPSPFLDNTAPSATKRTEDEIMTLSVVVSKLDRATCRQNDKKTFQKLEEKAKKGIDTKLDYFDATSVSDITSDKGFSGVQTTVKTLNRHLVAHQMDDVFTVPSAMTWNRANQLWQPAQYAMEMDLRQDYANVELDEIKKFSNYVREFGPSYMVENLVWSQEAILNSCTERLRLKINEQLDKIPLMERSGPVAFKIMMTYVLSTSNDALRALITKLGTLKLTDFDGENVIQAATFIENLWIMLRDNKMVPKDFDESVQNMFKESTCPKFVKLVESIESNMRFKIKEYETTEYLAILEGEYTKFISAGTWPAKSTKNGKNASFGAFKEGGRDMSKILCLNCLEPGHMVKDCPKEIDRQAIAENKKKIFRNYDNRRTRGGGGGGHGSSGNGNGGDAKKTIVNPRRVPPGPNDSKEKTIDGKKYKWCGRCGLWTNHSTEEHKTKAELEAAKASNQGANVSTDGGSYAGATALNF